MINENDAARNAIKDMFGVGDNPITEQEIKSVKSESAEVTGRFTESQSTPEMEEKKVVHETSATKRLITSNPSAPAKSAISGSCESSGGSDASSSRAT